MSSFSSCQHIESAWLRCSASSRLRLVLVGVRVGVLAHLLDLVFRQPARLLDADRLLLAGAQVLGRDVEDAVGVDVELDFDLRHAARRRRNAFQVELPSSRLSAGHLPLALVDLHRDGRLVVVGRAEDLLPLGRESSCSSRRAWS